ncbi:hypothetical protein [uncultured Winogradskyella sp.]|uniref:hypothetical protein n=1 Tax=uncultured Winogradskyella sp. TaxID=395353 RepID=UPI0026320B02|nr:hypothetical protein [uncultured Winogradskyella sp.]|tara:strand:+ start:3290 stop:3766 length:477 start_codon:yes stop_codon:yes gene_type:complete
MNRIVCLLILLFATSCNYFEKKKVTPEDLLEEELQTFNWNEVDTYPTFTSCETLTAKEESKACFQNTLITNVNAYLAQQKIIVTNDVFDTIKLSIIIDKQGLLTVESMKIHPETIKEIPEIDSLLRQSLKSVPKIFPAIKRGQQVTTAFELPVIVQIN